MVRTTLFDETADHPAPPSTGKLMPVIYVDDSSQRKGDGVGDILRLTAIEQRQYLQRATSHFWCIVKTCHIGGSNLEKHDWNGFDNFPSRMRMSVPDRGCQT